MRTLIDTGPLVAYINKRDEHHTWARQQTARLARPFYSCEAVFAEAHHLVAGVPGGMERLLSFVERELIEFPFSYGAWTERAAALMRTYADVPMDFADACLVCMTEQQSDSRVFTLDSDFHIYRRAGGEPLNVLLP